MTDFQATTLQTDGTFVVALSGECDLRVRDELTTLLRTAVDTFDRVVVDLAALDFMDSSGVHALVAAQQAAEERHRHVYAINATGTVATVLELTGVIELLRPPSGPDHAETTDTPSIPDA